MGNEKVRYTEFVLQIVEKIDDLGLNRNIQGGKRFIADYELGLKSQGPRHTETLPLASAKFVRIPVCHIGCEPHDV